MGNIPNQNRHLSRHSNAVRLERSFFEIPSLVLSPFVAIDALSTLNFVPDISHISELGVFFPFFFFKSVAVPRLRFELHSTFGNSIISLQFFD